MKIANQSLQAHWHLHKMKQNEANHWRSSLINKLMGNWRRHSSQGTARNALHHMFNDGAISSKSLVMSGVSKRVFSVLGCTQYTVENKIMPNWTKQSLDFQQIYDSTKHFKFHISHPTEQKYWSLGQLLYTKHFICVVFKSPSFLLEIWFFF